MVAVRSHERSHPGSTARVGDQWVSIRPIERTDASALSDFYNLLSPESLRRRFLGCSRRSGTELATAFTRHDGEGFVAILAERGPSDGAVVGHATLQPDGTGGAEVAFAVADDLQGRGIGHRLMDAVVARARSTGLRRLNATLFADNAPMLLLLRDAEGSLVSDSIESGVEEVVLAI